MVTIDDIVDAKNTLTNIIHETPVLTCSTLDLPKTSFLFKAELFQKTGSFKIRGAYNSIYNLLLHDKSIRERGVITHSSGNHGQALAYAAKLLNVPAIIVMPSTSPSVKKNAVAGYGAKVVECNPTLSSRESTVENLIAQTGAVLVHPYNFKYTIAGQGTLMLEFLQQAKTIKKPLDIVIVPVGGGGLLSGCCIAGHHIKPDLQIIAAEPEEANDTLKSWQQGVLVPAPDQVHTIADGLKTSLGTLTWPIIKTHISRVVTVSEIEIKQAMQFVWERMKLVVEPSSAVGVAVAIKITKFDPNYFENKNVGIVLCGGNLDLTGFFANL